MNTLHYQLQEGVSYGGVITFTNFIINCQRALEIDAILKGARNISSSMYHELIAELKEITQVRQRVVHNTVLLAARSAQAGRLAGDTTYTGIINYGALGTSATAITDADVDLGTEVCRKGIATVTQTLDAVAFDFYYSKSDTNGTYQEFGLVIDGTVTANSGLLYNRALTGGWTKTSLESMTVSIQVNINAV